MNNIPSSTKDDSGFYEPYAEFAKNLRTWFLAYGIGVPVLLLTNESIWNIVLQSGSARFLGAVFLAGVAIQIILAIVYKAAMWQLYAGELDPGHKSSWIYKFAHWFSDQFLFEFFMDLFTLGLFGWATIKTLFLITKFS